MTDLHPTLSPERRRALFLEGIELFNRGEHFAAHEPFEEIWRSTTPEPRDLFQGLVQLAAGLHHWHRRGKAGPARRVLGRGLERLRGLGEDEACGLDLRTLCRDADIWHRWLEAPREPAPAPLQIALKGCPTASASPTGLCG